MGCNTRAICTVKASVTINGVVRSASADRQLGLRKVLRPLLPLLPTGESGLKGCSVHHEVRDAAPARNGRSLSPIQTHRGSQW